MKTFICVQNMSHRILNPALQLITMLTPLHLSALRGSVEILRAFLICTSIHFKCLTTAGETAFHLAARFGNHKDSARWLAESFRFLIRKTSSETQHCILQSWEKKFQVRFLPSWLPSVTRYTDSERYQTF